jgi:diacylglycerol kinase
MRRMYQSWQYAISGFLHAINRERNLVIYLCVYFLVLLFGGWVQIESPDWIALIFCGGIFTTTELLNTSIERLADVVEHERHLLGRTEIHENMRWAKDVAAAASLGALVTSIAVIIIVFWPYLVVINPMD